MQTMAETATESITIAAPLDKVWEIATDLEQYPIWTHDVKEVVITSRDDEGRPHEVEFRTSALGRSTHYTLEYDYTSAPKKLAWSMVKGDIQRVAAGHATADGDRGGDMAMDAGGRLQLADHPGHVAAPVRVDGRRVGDMQRQ